VFVRNYTTNPLITKSQYGYRSGPLPQDEKDAINAKLVDGSYTWGESRSVQNAIEKVENVTTQTPRDSAGRPSVVNERRYWEAKSPSCTIELAGQYWPWGAPAPYPGADHRVGHVCAALSPDNPFGPPERGTYEYRATQLMRSMRPTKPQFELARFIGELKDLPQFWQWSNYNPGSVGEIGGAYLNQVFGVAPTWSDLNAASKAVLGSDQILREFALKATQTVKRKRSLILDTGIRQTRGSLLAGISNIVDYGNYYITGDLGDAYASSFDVGCEFDITVDRRRELRVFADFEYYIGDPEGFLGRIDSYRDKARKLLGTGVSPSTVYDLTPWTWLGNWFVDISGLLKYQQDVADNGLIARNSGFLIEDRVNLLAQPFKVAREGNGIQLMSNHPLVATSKWQYRWAGSPYSMSPNWDLSNFQWAIAGALGFTKANRIPFLRKLT
jgi:hypothetical protein